MWRNPSPDDAVASAPHEIKAEEEKDGAMRRESQFKSRPKADTFAHMETRESPKYSLAKKVSLLSHMDSVRGLTYLDQDQILVSVSEDCLIKLWDIKDTTDPYFTIRGHIDPIFAVCQSFAPGKDKFIFTAGSEGQVHAWEIPKPTEVVPYGPSEGKSCEAGSWKAHKEAVWQVAAHPNEVAWAVKVGAGGDGGRGRKSGGVGSGWNAEERER